MPGGLSPEEFLNVTRHKFKKMVKDAKPLMCWFSLTEGCNLHCKYCFADSSKPLENELTTKDIYRILDNIVQAGTQAVVFGGGEPTLREDLLQIAKYASKNLDLFVALNTHGQLLADKSYVKALARAGFTQIKISVDGLEESHDWNRGSGTFEKCIQALKNCAEEGIPSIWLLATISQVNYEEVPQLIKLGLDLGVDVGMVQLLPIGKGVGRKDLMLTREQTREWQRFMFEQQKIHGVTKVQFEDRYQICEDEFALSVAADPYKQARTFFDTPAGCITGIWQYIITAEGKVVIGDVVAPELEIGDLMEQKLSEIWQNSELANLLRDRDKLKGKCGRCELRFVCGGCKRMAYSLTGDIMAADPQCWYKPSLVLAEK